MRTMDEHRKQGLGSYRTPNEAFHVTAALLWFLLNPKGYARAAARDRGRSATYSCRICIAHIHYPREHLGRA
jgi:hypothetical protein